MRYVLRIIFSEHNLYMPKKNKSSSKKQRKKRTIKKELTPPETEEDEEEPEQKITMAERTKTMLKAKINEWFDADDKLKSLAEEMKELRKSKKENESTVIKMITALGMEERKIDVTDENNNLRGRVYRYKSVTKGTLKEDIIKDALMEIMQNETRVEQLLKKIDSKRPIIERYYLKRSKGQKE